MSARTRRIPQASAGKGTPTIAASKKRKAAESPAFQRKQTSHSKAGCVFRAARDYLASVYGEPAKKHPVAVRSKIVKAEPADNVVVKAEPADNVVVKAEPADNVVVKAEPADDDVLDAALNGGGCDLSAAPSSSAAAALQLEPVTVLDQLIRTMLSQNTTDATSIRAFRELKRRYPRWESVRTASAANVADAIRVGGLADVKAERIQVILNYLYETRGGELSLEYLHDEPDDEKIKAFLKQFKGVGPKTISCVLLFALRRADFPVDTHVWKISLALRWIPKSATREQAYDLLNSAIPDDIKFDLHVLLVEHGKNVAGNDPGAELRRIASH
ncbi:endonuclease III [Pycnococcus provasolii]